MPSPGPLCTLRGLHLSVHDSNAAAAMVKQVLGLPGLPAEGQTARRVGIGDCSLTLHPRSAGHADSLVWHCSDLAAQHALLGNFGIEATACADAGLCVDPIDTGACALAWTDEPALPIADEGPPSSARLRAIALHTRAPERVASHWSQLLRTPLSRDARGAPRLCIDGLSISFVLADDGADPVRELTLAVTDVEAVAQRAAAAGIERIGDSLSLAGLRVRLTGM